MRQVTQNRAPVFVAALVMLVIAYSIYAARETVAHFEKNGAKIVFELSSKK